MSIDISHYTRLIWLAVATVGVVATRFKAPVYDFVSRPDIQAPRLSIDTYNATEVAPGHIFMTPFSPEVKPNGPDSVNYQYGPMIYDNSGELVYSGFNKTDFSVAHHMLGTMGFSVCEFHGKSHLCFAHYVLDQPVHNDIMNASYELVRSVSPTGMSDGYALNADLHEFNLIQGSATFNQLQKNVYAEDTAIISSSTTRQLEETWHFEKCDLTVDWIKSSVFQEVKLDGSNEVLFEWNSFDHIPLEDSNCPDQDGIIAASPSDWKHMDRFDHFHMNAIDKDRNGDYYVSGRHTSSFYKISGKNGSVLWQVGPHHNGFKKWSEVDGIDFQFAFQHHLRLHQHYPGTDVDNGIVALSLFDNANERYDYKGHTAKFSSGKVFVVNEKKRTAVLKEAYTLFRDHKHQLATNQGSFQLLPNGNRLLGGGDIQEVVEWQPGNPEPVFRAHWGDWETTDGENGHKINSYRSMRFEWSGHPRWKPALFVFARDCGPQMTSYVSWNGATDVKSWSFWGSESIDGDFRRIGDTERRGFETSANLPFTNFLYAVAHDVGMKRLGRSSVVQVSVLNADDNVARLKCGDARCDRGFDYKSRATRSCSQADLATDFETDQSMLSPQEHAGDTRHCDPCFEPLQGLATAPVQDVFHRTGVD